ncbi:MAG: GNAT family N-acetyltransferase [Candidatus Muiribacteriota bacterium]
MWYLKKFENLTPLELYEILKRRNEVFVFEQKCLYKDCDNKDQEAFHLFYKKNNKVIAYLRIIPSGISYNEPSIGRVLVIPEFRKKGLCREGMQQAMEFIKNNMNSTSIRISAQKYLIFFYKSLGFRVTSDLYYEDNLPHYEMLKE